MKYNVNNNLYNVEYNRLGSDTINVFFQDGFKGVVNYDALSPVGNYTISDIFATVSNFITENEGHGSLIGFYLDFGYNSGSYHYLFSTSLPDYWTISMSSMYTTSATITLKTFNNSSLIINSGSTYMRYCISSTYLNFNSNPANQYANLSKQLNGGYTLAIDRNNEESFNYIENDYFNDIDVVAINIGSSLDYCKFDIGYGTPFKDYAQNEYQTGFNDGFNAGVSNGYDNGWENGYSQGHSDGYYEGFAAGSDLDSGNVVLDGFTIASKSFTSLGTVLNIEIFPHVTLGVVFSVPFVFMIIALAFRLFKR